MSSTSKEQDDVFVVLRADLFHAPPTALERIVTAKKVVWSESLAASEVARLNALHHDGQVKYWYVHSRLFPAGQSASSVEPPA